MNERELMQNKRGGNGKGLIRVKGTGMEKAFWRGEGTARTRGHTGWDRAHLSPLTHPKPLLPCPYTPNTLSPPTPAPDNLPTPAPPGLGTPTLSRLLPFPSSRFPIAPNPPPASPHALSTPSPSPPTPNTALPPLPPGPFPALRLPVAADPPPKRRCPRSPPAPAAAGARQPGPCWARTTCWPSSSSTATVSRG